MTRTFYQGFSVFAVAVVLLCATSAFAHTNADYSYEYDYDYDNSIHHSFNNYDSYNTYYDHGYDSYAYDGYYSYNSSYAYQPNCSITVNNSSGNYGYDRTITLAWSSSYATSAYLSGVGSVGTNGAQAIYYPYASSYTLTVYGPGGSASCSTNNPSYASQFYYDSPRAYAHASNVSYAYPLYNYSAYATPTYAYPAYTVSLQQIPYTGFDYGTMGNAMYWLMMILVAVAGAYLIVYSHSGAYPRVFAREVAAAARNHLRVLRSFVR